jgi:hypothetical protein
MQHTYRFLYSLLFLGSTLILDAQSRSIILGRPTDHSITASVLFEESTEFYFEIGITSGNYTVITSTVTNQPGIPEEVVIGNLVPNQRYYYQMYYRALPDGVFQAEEEHTFMTQRAAHSEYTFTIEADEHLYDHKGVPALYDITIQNQILDNPDFMLSLGDMFGDDHNPETITEYELDTLHKYYRPLLGTICHSVPFFFCLGNHEGEFQYYINQNPPANLGCWGTKYRKMYYPNPYPDDFYSGNATLEPYGMDQPENYYAWEWGDALFMVIDVYRHQSDTSAHPSQWDWTLGEDQYTWLKNTLQSSTQPLKFVFGHHVSGWGRGAADLARKFEWGGLNNNGNTNGFAANRPGWEAPIHQLFVDNGVQVFFQGHDHVFAHEVLDGIMYQTLPMAADSTYSLGFEANADAFLSDTLTGSGHMRVHVEGDCATIEFVRAYLPEHTTDGLHQNQEVAYSYTVGPCTPAAVLESVVSPTRIAPVPAHESLRISGGDENQLPSIKLYTLQGSYILSERTRHLETGDLPSGVYLMHIEWHQHTETKRIIIQHP